MKTNKFYLTALVLLSLITWSCTSQDGLNDINSSSLKVSIQANAQSLTNAMNTITSSPGYSILSSQSSGSSSNVQQSIESGAPVDTTYSSYALTDIAGIWNYKAANYRKYSPSLLRFFVNGGTNTDMIVNLPESKVKNFGALQHFNPADTALVNNYKIDVSKYYYSFNQYRPGLWYWDYNMASNISVSGVSAGDLAMTSSNHIGKGYNFTASFAFANGYSANTLYTSGDTIVSLYNITQNNSILYQEKYTAVKTTGSRPHFTEKQYSLTIGKVEIVRNAGPNSLDSAKVYVNGVLQLHSTVKMVADTTVTITNTTDPTVTHSKRTIQITFDDGTTTTVKALLGNTITDINNLFATLRQAYFSTNIVDWIAWDLYINKK